MSSPFTWYSKEQSFASTVAKIEHAKETYDLKLRFLHPSDSLDVKKLCRDCFPIDYPESWYEDITSDAKFYSLGAYVENNLAGIIVAEIKDYNNISDVDRNIISPSFNGRTEVAYILSLAVRDQYRRNGIASVLLNHLTCHLTDDVPTCKAVYLHVLATNTAALRFYETKAFTLHSFLPYYYTIGGNYKDGFTYVLYINGGRPRTSFLDSLKCGLMIAADSWMWRKVRWMFQWMMPAGFRQLLLQNASSFAIRHN